MAELFAKAGLAPTVAFSCDQLVREADRDLYGLIVLDPDFVRDQGPQCLQKIRAVSPVPMMTVDDLEDDRGSEVDVVLGPEQGPTDIAERANGLIQMSRPVRLPVPLRWGALELDLARHQARWQGRDIPLSILQFKIMEVLMLAAGDLVTDEQLTMRVWRNSSGKDQQRLVSQIRRIRQLIERDSSNPQFLVRVRGRGFRLDDVSPRDDAQPAEH